MYIISSTTFFNFICVDKISIFLCEREYFCHIHFVIMLKRVIPFNRITLLLVVSAYLTQS